MSAAAASVPIVYGDEWLAVVDKPAGLVVHPAPGVRGPTLVELLADQLEGGADATRPGIVHRLDRDTSGLMLVARDARAHSGLARAIAAREVEREYLALLDGVPRSRSGAVDAALGRDHRQPERRAVGGRGARAAVTRFEVLEALGDCSLVRLRLETGRTHQIRVHMAAIGHPVAGDGLYGGRSRAGLSRQFLHSARLALAHPVTDEPLEARSELPDELATVLQRARASSSR